ncbi:MAG: PPOX class F420-dependent oxidoreductase [Anaerolineae bacterium]
MKQIPASHQDLLKDEPASLAYLATLMPDGTPQLTPLWFDSDGEHIVVNSAKGRVKDRNMRARRDVAVVIQDPADPYRYIQVRGSVVEITEEGALEHMDRLSMKYRKRHWAPTAGQVRVSYKILPASVFVDE